MVTKTNPDRDVSQPGHRLPDKILSSLDGMRTKWRKRTATAKQYARRHLLRRLREAGHEFSTDLNPVYETIYAVGVEKQGKQSRLQVIPGEAFVMGQQSSDDTLRTVHFQNAHLAAGSQRVELSLDENQGYEIRRQARLISHTGWEACSVARRWVKVVFVSLPPGNPCHGDGLANEGIRTA